MSAKFERSRFFRTCLCCQPSLADPSRRSFLGSALATVGLGAMGVTAVGPGARAQAQSGRGRIDVHHHFLPPFHVDALMAPGRGGGAPTPKWAPALPLGGKGKRGITPPL